MNTTKTISGYSGTPLAQKLGLKSGMKTFFYKAPMNYLPQIKISKTLPKSADFIQAFVKTEADLKKIFPKFKKALAKTGMIWISWPKQSARVATDISENLIRDIGLQIGLVDVKVCAVDETWSGLKFVYRLKDRTA